MTHFSELGLSPEIMASVERLGYADPTPVQAQAIPFVLKGRHVVAAAQTGTGKTAAFTLPVMQMISRAKGKGVAPQALIVTPTRELAAQIEKVARTVGYQTKLRVGVVVGGMKYGPQIERLTRGVDVLVATPGRLIDLIDNENCDLSQVKILVLDEADRMLDMGFWPPVKKILSHIKPNAQKLLFSATMGDEVSKLIGTYMDNPAFIEIARKGTTADQIEQCVMPVEHSQKPDLLLALLDRQATGKTLVFTRTKRRADSVAKILRRSDIKCEPIHGDRSQGQRTRALEQFAKGKIDVLVTTDVIARGIHIDAIDHVINYDTPVSPEDYVHRIGRTGRAGATGNAITFVGPEEIAQLREIEFLLATVIQNYDLEGFPYRSGRIIPSAERVATKTKPKPFASRRGGSNKAHIARRR